MDTPTDAIDPHIGRVLQDRYEILRLLGRGGMGSVYEAEHVLIQRRFAVKFLHPELASRTDAVQRFVNEARAASSIGNEHIVRVTDMGRLSDREHYMVLEYLEGESLAELLDGDLVDIDRLLRIARMVCDALEAAHSKGIVHRDLKPENIFLVPTDEGDFVKLLDFGIAKFHDGATSLTKTGAVMGTPAYMAPEQARGRHVDARTDIFSLGVILYEALSGFHPFDADSFVDILYRVAHVEPERLDRYRPDLEPHLVELVHRMLAKQPAERPETCANVELQLVRHDMHARGVDPLQHTAPQGHYERTTPVETLDSDKVVLGGELVETRRAWWSAALIVVGLMVGGISAYRTAPEVSDASEPSPTVLPSGLPAPSAFSDETDLVGDADAVAPDAGSEIAERVEAVVVRRRRSSRMRTVVDMNPPIETPRVAVPVPIQPPIEMDPPPLSGFKRVQL